MNKEMVIVIAVLGHHGSFVILFGCYLRVLFVVRRQRKVAATKSAVQESISHVSGRNQNTSAINYAHVETEDIPSVSNIRQNDNHLHVSALENDNSTKMETSSSGRNIGNQSNQKMTVSRATKDAKVFITLTYIIVGYVICWVPFHVVYDVTAIRPDLVSNAMYTFAFWLTYINSTLNPFLYNFGSSEFRSAFREIIRGGH
jgi:hypothetical protein